jgi:hypothetical protein
MAQLKPITKAEITVPVLEYLHRSLTTDGVLLPTSLPFSAPCALCALCAREMWAGLFVPGVTGLACMECGTHSYLLGLVEYALKTLEPALERRTALVELVAYDEEIGLVEPAVEPPAVEAASGLNIQVTTCEMKPWMHPPVLTRGPLRPTYPEVEPLVVGDNVQPLTVGADAPPLTSGEPITYETIATPEQKEEPHTIRVMPGDKLDIWSLPSGTVLKFGAGVERPEIDRTPVGPGFDINSVPEEDRALIRYEGDPEVGPAVVRKWAGEARFDFPVDEEAGETGPPRTIVIRNAGDVRCYEAAHGDPEIMEAIEAEEREEFGDEVVDQALEDERNTVQRQGRIASISLPGKCFPPDF